MAAYFIKRIATMILILFLISIVNFMIIQLPPGDYLTTYIMALEEEGMESDEVLIENLRARYGLDKPVIVQYGMWAKGVLQGDFGMSFEWKRPVSDLIWERLVLTLIISFVSLLFTYAVAIPTGIYSATHQYTMGDYIVTFLGFIGLAMPGFLLALVLMFLSYKYFGVSIGGLFSPDMIDASWSIYKVWDLIKHLWIPVIVVGAAGTCSLIRIMRGSLLDELKKQYVITARAKGMDETKLLIKYPVRVALNPLVSTVGYILPQLISGATIVSIVLGLPTTGPMLLKALLSQDMYLAGAFLLILATLTVIGTFISDLLLVIIDPRIRMSRRNS